MATRVILRRLIVLLTVLALSMALLAIDGTRQSAHALGACGTAFGMNPCTFVCQPGGLGTVTAGGPGVTGWHRCGGNVVASCFVLLVSCISAGGKARSFGTAGECEWAGPLGTAGCMSVFGVCPVPGSATEAEDCPGTPAASPAVLAAAALAMLLARVRYTRRLRLP